MSYLSAATLADVAANPQNLANYYTAQKSTFAANLGSNFSAQCDNHLRLAFCGVAAFELKPYGSSTAKTLADILAASSLDCDNYVLLAWYLFLLMRPISSTHIVAVGWNGGAVGNHAQMYAQTAGSPDILVDPTIGLIVNGQSLDALCQGYHSPASALKSFFGYDSRSSLTTFEANVRNAILNGEYKAHDMMYWIDDPAKLANLPPREDWLTPQG